MDNLIFSLCIVGLHCFVCVCVWVRARRDPPPPNQNGRALPLPSLTLLSLHMCEEDGCKRRGPVFTVAHPAVIPPGGRGGEESLHSGQFLFHSLLHFYVMLLSSNAILMRFLSSRSCSGRKRPGISQSGEVNLLHPSVYIL